MHKKILKQLISKKFDIFLRLKKILEYKKYEYINFF